MHMRSHDIQQKQKTDSDHETDGGGNKRELTHTLAVFKSGLQKTPERCGDHDTRSKAGEDFLQGDRDTVFEKKDHCGPQTGACKGNQNTAYDIKGHLIILRQNNKQGF